MNIAVFADVHGRVLLAFLLCARWERETGEKIDLILQAGDLGAYADEARLDRATRKYAERDKTELGFLENFCRYDKGVAEMLGRTTCPMVFVRGNHEDHEWLDGLEAKSEGAVFPVDVYGRVFNLKTGVPWSFRKGDEEIVVVGIGRVERPSREMDWVDGKYVQGYELKRLKSLGKGSFDVLLTHDARPDFVLREDRVKRKVTTGMVEIGEVLDRYRPELHFFGHYGGPPQVRVDTNGVTQSVKLADLHWRPGETLLDEGSMGMLRWRGREDYAFELVDEEWLGEYGVHGWRWG